MEFNKFNKIQRSEKGLQRSPGDHVIEDLLKTILREENINIIITPNEEAKTISERKEISTDQIQKAFQKLAQDLHIGSAIITDEKIEFDKEFSAPEKIKKEITEVLKEYKKIYIDENLLDTMGKDEDEEKDDDGITNDSIKHWCTYDTIQKLKDELDILGIELKDKYFISEENDKPWYKFEPLLYINDVDKFLLLLKIDIPEEERTILNRIIHGFSEQLFENDRELMHKQVRLKGDEIMKQILIIEEKNNGKYDYGLLKRQLFCIKNNRRKEFEHLRELGFCMDIDIDENEKGAQGTRMFDIAPMFLDDIIGYCIDITDNSDEDDYEDEEIYKDEEMIRKNRQNNLLIMIHNSKEEIEDAIKYIQEIRKIPILFWQARKELLTGIHTSMCYIQETKVLEQHQKQACLECFKEYYNTLWDSI